MKILINALLRLFFIASMLAGTTAAFADESSSKELDCIYTVSRECRRNSITEYQLKNCLRQVGRYCNSLYSGNREKFRSTPQVQPKPPKAAPRPKPRPPVSAPQVRPKPPKAAPRPKPRPSVSAPQASTKPSESEDSPAADVPQVQTKPPKSAETDAPKVSTKPKTVSFSESGSSAEKSSSDGGFSPFLVFMIFGGILAGYFFVRKQRDRQVDEIPSVLLIAGGASLWFFIVSLFLGWKGTLIITLLFAFLGYGIRKWARGKK